MPLGGLVGQGFDGTMYTLIGAFAVSGLATLAAMRWAEGGSKVRAADVRFAADRDGDMRLSAGKVKANDEAQVRAAALR